MAANRLIYTSRERSVQVSATHVRTRRHLIAIADVQAIETRRPYVVHAAVIGGVTALMGVVFWPELAPVDRGIFIGLPALGMLGAAHIGSLKVSFAFKDEVIHGPYHRLLRIRRAIEQALLQRAAAPNSTTPSNPLPSGDLP